MFIKPQHLEGQAISSEYFFMHDTSVVIFEGCICVFAQQNFLKGVTRTILMNILTLYKNV